MISNLAGTDKEQLLRAFSSFAEVSSSLERAYVDLHHEVRRLSTKLEESNQYLNALLHSLPCGILVMNNDRVITLNEKTRRLLSLSPVSLPGHLDQILNACPYKNELHSVFSSPMQPAEVSLTSTSPKILGFSWARMRNGEHILVIQDITEMRSLERQMVSSKQLAAMGEMAMELAHEIRNPLAALELFAELLRQEELSDRDRQRCADNIQIGVRSLNTVVGNMLCFSRNPEPTKKPLVIAQLLEDTASFMEPLMKQRGIQLHQNYADRRTVSGDPEMLRQVFNNLILNAMQALPEGGKLELQTVPLNGEVAAVIRDDGIGISESLQDSVFDPHFTTDPEGQGLGLAIVKRIVELHGGRIELTSRKEWGTQFTLLLPKTGS